MWIDRLRHTCSAERILHHLVHADIGKRRVNAVASAVSEEHAIGFAIVRSGLDQAIEASQKTRRDRYVADSPTLAEHAQVRLSAGPHDVLRLQARQLIEAEPAVSEDPDDQLVALVLHHALQEVNLFAAQHVTHPLFPA